jgi:hypothetical protein
MRSYTNVNKSAPKSAKCICYDNTNGTFPDNKQGIPNIFNKIQRVLAKSFYRSRAGRHFYGTENEIWAGFGPDGNTEKTIWGPIMNNF